MTLSVGALVLLMACATDEAKTLDKARTVHVTLPVLASIVGEIAEPAMQVESVLGPGQSAHTFEPRPSSVRAASRSALLVFGAEHLDDWALHVPGVRSISLMSLLPDSLKLMATEGHASVDPHFWTDPLAVRAILDPLASALCDTAPGDCDIFRDNVDRFATQLDSLHKHLVREMTSVRGARFVFLHSFFNYFMTRYGLEAIVIGGTDGLETSPRRIARLTTLSRSAQVTALLVEGRESITAPRVLAAEIKVPLVILDIVGDPHVPYADLLKHNSLQIVALVSESKHR